MASVLPLRSAATGVVTYRVRFRIDGQQRQETFPEFESAQEFKRTVENVGGATALRILRARQHADVSMPTLRQFTERYLDADSGLLTGIEPGTRRGYEQIANNSFLPILGDYPVDAVTKTDVGRWVGWQEKQKSRRQTSKLIAPKTVRNYHSLLSAIFTAAIEEGLRTDNPAHKTRLSRGVKYEGVFLTRDEFATLLAFIPQRDEGLIMFLAGTGCRWGEATAITWGDLNIEANPPTVRINKAWKKGSKQNPRPVLGPPKSEKARRTISLSHDVVAALGKPRASNELVFTGELSGKHLWYGRIRSRVWEPAVAKAMDPVLCEAEGLTPLTRHPTIHDLRHTHASWLVAGGVPLPHVQVRMGHENIQTTVNTYTHLQPDAHVAMSSLIADKMVGVRPLRQLDPLELTA